MITIKKIDKKREKKKRRVKKNYNCYANHSLKYIGCLSEK